MKARSIHFFFAIAASTLALRVLKLLFALDQDGEYALLIGTWNETADQQNKWSEGDSEAGGGDGSKERSSERIVGSARAEPDVDKEQVRLSQIRTAEQLPLACRTRYGASLRTGLPKAPPKLLTISTDVQGVPSEYLSTQEIPDLQSTKMTAYAVDIKNDRIEARHASPLTPLPTNITFVCLPDGIVVDSSIAGPYNNDESTLPIYLHQNKKWFASPKGVEAFLGRNPRVVDVPGLGVQLSGWTGFTWNHFSVDTLVRLAIVYDALISGDHLWRNAKLVVSGDVFGSGSGTDAMNPMVAFLYDRLNLTHRLVNNNGWIVKANTTARFEFLLFPDVAPHPICGPNKEVIDPVFPQGLLRPVQSALGLKESSPRKWIVYARRKGRRAVELRRKKLLLQAIQRLLTDMDSKLQIIDWDFSDNSSSSPADALGIFQNAAAVIGPHGANLWNAALMPPGGLLIEFSTWGAEFTEQDCRSYAFSLASAAGHNYALVHTESFGYERRNLLPDVNQTVSALQDFLAGTHGLSSVQANAKPKAAVGNAPKFARSDDAANKRTEQGKIGEDGHPKDKQHPIAPNTTKAQNSPHGLSIAPNVLTHLRSLPDFPKIVHVMWTDKNVLDTNHAVIQHGIHRLIGQNPDWKVIVHNNSALDETIQNFHHPSFPKQIKQDLLHAHIVEKTDAFRLICIYQTGGLYIDIDRVMNIPLKEIIDTERTKLVVPTHYDINFAQDLFGSSPGNELILDIFKLQCSRRLGPPPMPRRQGWIKRSDHMRLTYAHSHSLEQDIFGRHLGQGKKEIWDEARRVINEETEGMIVTQKDMWCDGLLIRDYDGCKQVSREPLYRAYNITSWGDAVDAVWAKETH